MADSNPEDRRTLLHSAAGFLSEPSVQDAPLTKKVEFLKEKGLTEQEIEKALKDANLERAGGKQHSTELNEQGNFDLVVNHDQWYEAVPPPPPRRDWKDYFIMATTTVGVCYGLYEVTKRYILPQLLPESKSKLEEDKQQIDSHFEKVDKLLETIEKEQEELRSQQQEKLKQLDITILKLQSALEDTTKTRNNISFEFRDLKLQVNELGKKIEDFKFTRENSKQLVSLQNDIDSLKLLVKNSVFKKDDASNGTGGPLLSAASIPSASEILGKMKTKAKSPADEQRARSSMPAWRSSATHAVSTTPSPIPDWQKNAIVKDASPDNTRSNSKQASQNIDSPIESRSQSGPLSS